MTTKLAAAFVLALAIIKFTVEMTGYGLPAKYVDVHEQRMHRE